ncbi:unnamed protein product [Phytomonas sp. EM1]|nr:unnamed protein product [Phytomonas sp. EM1]|eukprot:CCW61921.1 unnamed protein product [Phytomonas sp. isolate EM1]
MEQESIALGYEDDEAEFLRELHRLQNNAREQKELLKCVQKEEKNLGETLEKKIEEEFQTSLQCARAELSLLELRDSNKRLQCSFDKAKNDCVNLMARQNNATKRYQKLIKSRRAFEVRRERLKRKMESFSVNTSPYFHKTLRTLEIIYNNPFWQQHVCKEIKEGINQVWDLCYPSITRSPTFNEDSICKLFGCFERFSETLSEEEQILLKALLSLK